jgi:hypothetical protein
MVLEDDNLAYRGRNPQQMDVLNLICSIIIPKVHEIHGKVTGTSYKCITWYAW